MIAPTSGYWQTFSLFGRRYVWCWRIEIIQRRP